MDGRGGERRPVSHVSRVHGASGTTGGVMQPVDVAARRQGIGDGAWEIAFETSYVELCEYVLWFLGSAELAEDLVHDLFLHLWETRGERDAVRLTRPYLFVAARNRALKSLRHRRVVDAWIARVAAEAIPEASSPEEIVLRRELERAAERAIGELPERCREVFLLRRRDHLSYDEIAVRLGVSVCTVKSHMWHAATKLRGQLAPYLVGAQSA
jgi:RNA polymerase sigma-70 factor (family 1)